jgi:hypothetical protein
MSTIQFEKVPIRDLRTFLALDRYDFAFYFGVPLDVVAGWESGDRCPPMTMRVLTRILLNAPKADLQKLRSLVLEFAEQNEFETAIVNIITSMVLSGAET